MIIAIDGPAASGKGTLARRLAQHYGLPHLDTGLLYRATAASLIDADRDLADLDAAVAAARGVSLTDFDETRLRGREMGEAASIVAALPEVRAALTGKLKELGFKFVTLDLEGFRSGSMNEMVSLEIKQLFARTESTP